MDKTFHFLYYMSEVRLDIMVIELQTEFENRKKEVLALVEKYVEKYHLNVSETIIDNLAIHLTLSITRELTGNYINTSQSQLEQCKEATTYKIAQELVAELAQDYDIEIPETDTYYAAMYLANMSLLDLDFNSEFDIVDDEIETIMNETLDKIKEKLGLDLRTNLDFYHGMTLHFYPALERLEEDKQLTDNPMVDRIQAEHEKEYQCAKILNDVVHTHYNKSFNEHELCYITLHFGTALYHHN